MQALIIKPVHNYMDAIKLPISKKKFFNGILENTYNKYDHSSTKDLCCLTGALITVCTGHIG